jgi:hypothetical protein
MRRVWCLVALALLVGCGRNSEPAEPAAVSAALAPAGVLDDLKLYENTDRSTLRAFANAGETSLVADGKVWEIRRADRLVGTLQISTVLPAVDLTDERERAAIAGQIVNGEVLRLRIRDVEVYSTVVNDKATFLWFGLDVLEVMQIKDRALADRYEDVATQIIDHQATVSDWKPLPLSVDDHKKK